jgi:hypothetical protein
MPVMNPETVADADRRPYVCNTYPEPSTAPSAAPRNKPRRVMLRRLAGRMAIITMAASVKRTARKSMTGIRETAFFTRRKVAPHTAVTATRALRATPGEDFQ